MEPIISVRGLGKSYRIQSGGRKPYRTLRDDLADFGKGLIRGTWRRSHTEEFWALKDIDFDIYPGEVVGIIGRNGAGKSTLLKILSRIIQPTTGEATLKGRVASLLEVGTGFHPELTGRENIFMSGAVLGMKSAEINRKFDEIVDFAEIEIFLDTPVKRYSSGMYVRLAFSIAAHLEPEILIIDEVLAVGDATFQKKCLGKMEDIATGKERTVLFVSHNMAAINALCKRGIFLKQGQLILDDRIEIVSRKYILNDYHKNSSIKFKTTQNIKDFCFKNLCLYNFENLNINCFSVEEKIFIQIEYELNKSFNDIEITLRICNSAGIPIFSTNRSSNLKSNLKKGKYLTKLEIPSFFLIPDSYFIDLAAHIPNVEILEDHKSVIGFEIEETGSNMSLYQNSNFGLILVNINWEENCK